MQHVHHLGLILFLTKPWLIFPEGLVLIAPCSSHDAMCLGVFSKKPDSSGNWCIYIEIMWHCLLTDGQIMWLLVAGELISGFHSNGSEYLSHHNLYIFCKLFWKLYCSSSHTSILWVILVFIFMTHNPNEIRFRSRHYTLWRRQRGGTVHIAGWTDH